jgi:lysophospholipase L1-like esterase
MYDITTGYPVAEFQTQIKTKAATVGNGVTRKCIFIGDSTVNAGTATQHLLDLMDVDVMNVTLLGTRGIAPNLHEGRGGWTAQMYNDTGLSGGISNPFLNLAKFDFPSYMSAQGYTMTTGDHVIINLGINDIFSNTLNDDALKTAIEAVLGYYDKMVTSIHAYNANIYVGLCCTIPPEDDQDSFGVEYSSSVDYHSLAIYKRNNYLFVKALMAKYYLSEGRKTYLVPIHASIDSKSNIKGVHPTADGYNQEGQIFFNYLKSFES